MANVYNVKIMYNTVPHTTQIVNVQIVTIHLIQLTAHVFAQPFQIVKLWDNTVNVKLVTLDTDSQAQALVFHAQISPTVLLMQMIVLVLLALEITQHKDFLVTVLLFIDVPLITLIVLVLLAAQEPL